MVLLEGRSVGNLYPVPFIHLWSLFRSFLTKHPAKEYPDVAENLLSIMERLQTFPTENSELNEWWVSELGTKPPPLKSLKTSQETADEAAEEDEAVLGEDDWRKFFDDPAPPAKQKANGPSARLHKMTVYQSLHSLASHRAVFSRAWIALLHQLSEVGDVEKRKALSVKALNVMHRGVMPHLTRPVLVMDWVASCVDYGMHSTYPNQPY
jgi:U3 small nucleolar RNA-associated protein 19